MPSFTRKKLKLLYILDILKKHSDEEHPLNANDIVFHLENFGIEAERKSVYNDISALEEYGYDIIKSSGAKVGWFLGEREFEESEIYLLADAVRAAKFISKKKTRQLVSKLDSMLSEHQVKSRLDSVYFGMPEKCSNEELYYNIDKINDAIKQKKQINLTYTTLKFTNDRKVENRSKVMTINPYALVWQEDHYYLVGNHSKYDNLLHLRLDRINRVTITENPARHFSLVCEYKDFFDIADYTNKIFGMHSGKIEDIEFSCDKSITEQVLDRFSQNIFIKNVTDTHFDFTVKGAISEALVTFIINYGNKLKVKKPEQLKQMVRNRAEQILEIYK